MRTETAPSHISETTGAKTIATCKWDLLDRFKPQLWSNVFVPTNDVPI